MVRRRSLCPLMGLLRQRANYVFFHKSNARYPRFGIRAVERAARAGGIVTEDPVRPVMLNNIHEASDTHADAPVISDVEPLPDAAELGRRVAERAMQRALAAVRHAARRDPPRIEGRERRARG